MKIKPSVLKTICALIKYNIEALLDSTEVGISRGRLSFKNCNPCMSYVYKEMDRLDTHEAGIRTQTIRIKVESAIECATRTSNHRLINFIVYFILYLSFPSIVTNLLHIVANFF